MILGQLKHSSRYFNMNERFNVAFQFIEEYKDKNFTPERLHLEGSNLIAILECAEGRGREKARLEVHRKYIDIQFTCEGTEEIGWKPYLACQNISHSYCPEKDIEFFSDAPSLWLPLPADTFAIFFPEDAHAPLAGVRPVRKIIMKVATN